ncbi:14562_t:CDS:10, partial [Ambispora leptoticha]
MSFRKKSELKESSPNAKSSKNIQAAQRRLSQLSKSLTRDLSINNDDKSNEDEIKKHGFFKSDNRSKIGYTLRIGDISIVIKPSLNPELVPNFRNPFYDDSQEILRHLRWIMQKDKLGQDIFLIGPPGHIRRGLILKYANLTNREIEYVTLSKDCTDSDLKQRREISAGTAYYVDQACVRAAIYGRILILDGIEKAERNVLPILNNLLENREMSLEDGRFLVHPKRYDSLSKKNKKMEMDNWKLVRVDDRFLVVALGVPVPPYIGHPLDPPLRSRFQSRDVKQPGFETQVHHLSKIAPNVSITVLERLVSIAIVLSNLAFNTEGGITIPEFPISIESSVLILQQFPAIKLRFLLDILYPWPLLPICEIEQRKVIETTYHRFGILESYSTENTGVEKDKGLKENNNEDESQQIFQATSGYKVAEIKNIDEIDVKAFNGKRIYKKELTFHEETDVSKKASVKLAGGCETPTTAEFFVETKYHLNILAAMLIAHSTGDFCLIGQKGVGKSALIRSFAKNLGYTIEFIPLYKDMSSRDLLQRRGTTFSGDTIWENSPLVKAAINGSLAVMDGIETLSFGTLTTLQRLIKEREMPLPDGKQLISHERYQNLVQNHGFTPEMLADRGILSVNPSFRIVALARPVSISGIEGKSGAWLSSEICAMFQFIAVRPLEYHEEAEVLHALSPGINEKSLELLLRFANRLRQDKDETIKILSDAFSTRQLIRICRRITAFPDESLYDSIHKAALSRFLPSLVKEALEELMIENGITPPSIKPEIETLKIEVIPSFANPEYLQIGNVIQPIARDSNPLLIPDILFHENPKQTEILMQMLKDYQLGENLLLIGNQGVGKNKLADYFLQILKLPREYIQLHRDTTVQSLTATPSIIDGVLQYEDSPLVKAVKSGYILVIDEADKAPTYVTAVLRNLIEDGEMVLGDGRRIVSRAFEKLENDDEDEKYILVHKNFRIIVLANRPGFPFLGNDFYREIGDVFSCHAVDNPDPASEMYLLRKYAPDISEDLLLKLTAAFSDLRRLVDEGLISYPYSTRELVNIVKHMQQYPSEGVSKVIQNVFDFDQYDKNSKALLIEVFQKHGIPIGLDSELSVQLGKFVTLSKPIVTEIWTKIIASERSLQVRDNKIEFQGGWEFHMKKAKELERTEGRTTTFTEQIYSFKIPTRGEALDIVGLEDGSLFAVTTNPVTLHYIDKEHHLSRSVELYEFFPLKDVPPQIKLAIVQAYGSAWFLTLHDPENNSVVAMDYDGGTVNSIELTGLAKQARKIMLKDFASLGILVFYQFFKSSIVILDFNVNTEYIITLPINVAQLYLLKPDVWLVRDCERGSYHIIYPAAGNIGWLPNVIEQIEIKNLLANSPHQPITFVSKDGVPRANVSSARFLHTKNESFALSIASNLPESLISNENDINPIEVVSYIREPEDSAYNLFENIGISSLFLARTGQLATLIPMKDGRNIGHLELFNPIQQTLWRIVVPLAIPVSFAEKSKFSQAGLELQPTAALLLELPSGDLLTMDNSGVVRVWQVNAGELIRAVDTWKKFTGVLDQHVLSIIYETDEMQEENLADENKSGFGIGKSEGSQKMGSGERDEAKSSLELTEAQKEMHALAMRQRLDQIKMTQSDSDIYRNYLANVQREIRELRVVLESVEAKKKERVWLKNQSSGDIDDTKLIEGITGDYNIYKRRGENDPEIGFFQEKPKKMYFVFDLSASMFRFNTHDRRLDRSIEVALMIMESFKSFENKFEYRILGHSGDSPNVEFVTREKYPKTEKDIFKVLKEMFTHSQFCLSGDNTLNATSHAIKDIVKEQADDYFVVVLSDANILQYHIKPGDIAKVLKSDERVSAFMIFIGSLQDQAE